MKLTVGPLPAAVYWRRRAAVLGVLLLLVLGVMAALKTGGENGSTGSGPGGAGGEPSASGGLLTPDEGDQGSGASTDPSAGTGGPGGSAGTVGATPTATASPAGGPCTDAEILLTPSTDPATPKAGQTTQMVLKIKNISSRTCSRDVGAGPQELRVARGTEVIWSSDYCQVGKGGSDVRTFGPGVEATFHVSWDGYPVAPGCVRGTAATPAGTYQLVARLDTKWSSPVTMVIGTNPS